MFVKRKEFLYLDLDSDLSKKMFYLLQWKPFRNDKNAFYLILKAFFVLKILKFLSRLFGHEEKTAWFDR